MIDRNEVAESADVLLVEPSPSAAASIRDGLLARGSSTNVHTVETGADAMAFLHGREGFSDAPDPCLVLTRIDLPGPGPDGIEMLETMTEEPSLGRIPVVVLATSPSDEVVARAYDRGASAVLPVPADPDDLAATMSAVARFWLSTARLPNRVDRR